jgi:hypothetical protein
MYAADPSDWKSYIGVLLGKGDGTFQPVVTLESGGYASSSVAVKDLNRDGKPDLVVFSGDDAVGPCTNGSVTVLLGNGDGTFQSPASYPSGAPCGFNGVVAVADVNRDGKQDVFDSLTALSSSAQVGVLLGNGDGTLQAPVVYDGGGFVGTALAVADLNGDALPDVMITECPVTGCSVDPADALGVLLHVGSIRTTTTISSSLNPSTFGQPVTLTATVTSGSGTPTGTMGFFDKSISLGATTLVNGTASMTFSSLGAGPHSITAVFQGSLKYKSSASTPLSQVVDVATTMTTVLSSRNPVPVKQAVTYSATVTSGYGGAVTGTLTFRDGSSTIAVLPLSGNQASYRTKYPLIGTHAITVAYSGDTNNVSSISPVLAEYVEYTSTTTVMTSGSPSLVGQPVTFTATVTSMYGPIPNGELVVFYDGTTAMASVALAGGKAIYTTLGLSAKAHSIKVVYGGDGIFMPSTGTVQQLVVKYATTTVLTSTPNPSNFGQLVTFTATVTSAGPIPTGKLKFLDGTLGIGTVVLNAGVATLSKSNVTIGTHAITAQYLSDPYNAKSTSPVVHQVVQ